MRRIWRDCLRQDPYVREMVLNHASLSVPNRHAAVDWLEGMTTGMSMLIGDGVVQNHLRMRLSLYEIKCVSGWSLFDACLALQQKGSREESVFFMSLSSKVPLVSDLDQNIEDRFRACQAKTFSSEDGAPLVLCAITDGVAVGFPSDPIWDREKLTVKFDEMVSDGSVLEASESIDNVTRAEHARPICERHRIHLRHQISSFTELWEKKGEAFPNLVFGPDVKRSLSALDDAFVQTIVNKLKSLDDTAAVWSDTKSGLPPWGSKVTAERNSVMNNAELREARRFLSQHGTRELFEWHARFGRSGRIHLRCSSRTYEIEIGYIGQHLPL